ncbi:MAG: DNA polymerase I [Parcubacteria group bacterium CG23_combo_of_CG06-09_8_20_14_all_35_9]|nr:MAG: DNA polymerase I [Parcubacteria group bacterium CG23_combo_of_CG06-09_8_20_14_all_35_9]
MPKIQQKFLIIDGNALLHRAWHALPPLTTKRGELVNAIYGFMMVFLKVLKELKPTYVAITFDKKAPTFRHKKYKEYKATRAPQAPELYEQIPRLKELISAFSVPIFEKEGFEADDLIGTLTYATKKYREKDTNKCRIENIIVTGDLDTLQLIDENTKVYTLKRGIIDTIIYDGKAVWERYNLTPSHLIDFKALRGDPSDNIPGVKGIGEKTAINLIKEFGSLEALYKAIEEQTSKAHKIKEKIRKALLEHKKDAVLSKKLVTIVLNAPIKFNLDKCRLGNFDRARIIKLFQELEFKSLLTKIPKAQDKRQETKDPEGHFDKLSTYGASKKQNEAKFKKQKKFSCKLVNNEKKFQEFLKEIKKQKIFVLDVETTDLDPLKAELLGVSFCWRKKEAYYLNFQFPIISKEPGSRAIGNFQYKWLNLLKPVLENPKIKKCGHNIKYDMEVLMQYGVHLKEVSFDTMIASYLLNPGSRAHSLDDIAFTELGYEMTPIENLIGPKGKTQISMAKVPLEKIAEYSCEDANYTFRLKEKIASELKEKNLLKLFENIEMPLVPVLSQMEINGVKIDAKLLEKISKKITEHLSLLNNRIYSLAGQEFNINSPKQLKIILFGKLKIASDGIKKTKTGISTQASELEKLRGKHPIIDFIEEHRELAKLKSTYLDALPKLINPKTGRVHTSFNQTITATGRLSSSNPNLQNIPIKGKIGQEIREAFVAQDGYKLISADYSQIELRIIASIAKDEKMINSFLKSEDIHVRTAAEIENCPLDKVTPQMRRRAKTINFGIIYGMGAYGLSQSAGISQEEAREFINKYFQIYKGIKKYIDEAKALAHSLGYVETLFGRRRWLPEINSSVVQIRNAAERMAINMPIQGTAADIMKLAMIAVAKALKKYENTKNSALSAVEMILQVHDELVFRVKENLVKEVSLIIKEEMEGVTKLKVPIEVKIKVGDNWGKMKRLKI